MRLITGSLRKTLTDFQPILFGIALADLRSEKLTHHLTHITTMEANHPLYKVILVDGPTSLVVYNLYALSPDTRKISMVPIVTLGAWNHWSRSLQNQHVPLGPCRFAILLLWTGSPNRPAHYPKLSKSRSSKYPGPYLTR